MDFDTPDLKTTRRNLNFLSAAIVFYLLTGAKLGSKSDDGNEFELLAGTITIPAGNHWIAYTLITAVLCYLMIRFWQLSEKREVSRYMLDYLLTHGDLSDPKLVTYDPKLSHADGCIYVRYWLLDDLDDPDKLGDSDPDGIIFVGAPRKEVEFAVLSDDLTSTTQDWFPSGKEVSGITIGSEHWMSFFRIIEPLLENRIQTRPLGQHIRDSDIRVLMLLFGDVAAKKLQAHARYRSDHFAKERLPWILPFFALLLIIEYTAIDLFLR